MGDLDAQVGQEAGYYLTIGTYNPHDKTNENGQRLINFTNSHGLVVESTMFLGKKIYKATGR